MWFRVDMSRVLTIIWKDLRIRLQIAPELLSQYDRTVWVGRKSPIKDTNKILLKRAEIDPTTDTDHRMAKH